MADYAIGYGMHALTTLYQSQAICRHVRESGRLLPKSMRMGENLERYMNPGDFPLNRETWSLCTCAAHIFCTHFHLYNHLHGQNVCER